MPLCAYVHPSVGPHLEKKLFLGGFGSLARLELALRGASVQLRVTARVDSKMQAACWQWLSKVKAVTCMLKQLSCSVTHGRHQLTGTGGESLYGAALECPDLQIRCCTSKSVLQNDRL